MAQTSDQQDRMYGCLIEPFKESIKDTSTYNYTGGAIPLISILSDVQEMIEHGDKNSARQYINRVKFLIMNADDQHQIRFD